MRDTHLHTPIPLSAWAVINLGRARDEQVHRFVENLVGAMISSGIFVEPAAQRPPIFCGAMRDASMLMTEAARAASEMIGGRRPQLLLVLKPDADQASYFTIKRISDTVRRGGKIVLFFFAMPFSVRECYY
eukprot:COSAG06_NODE_4573_length_4134_cov_2.409271_5_plen_131_part_00